MAKKKETNTEEMTYLQRMKKQKEEQLKEKNKEDGKYQLGSYDKDIASLDAFIQKSTKNLKVETLSIRDSISFFITTKSLPLNWIITNDFKKGIPGCRTTMISGESGKGKSLILDSILGENIKMGGASYKFDIEDAGTHDFTSKIMGSELIASKLRIIAPEKPTKETKARDKVITIEKLNSALNKMIDYQSSAATERKIKSVLVGIDSVTQLTTVKEIEDNIGEKDKKDLTSTQKIRELFRVITQQQKHGNMTIIGLAQLTANIGQMFGPTKVENAKGSGFKYNSSLALQATTDKEIVKSIKGGADIPIGIKMRFKTTKNRIEFKGRDAWLYFYFNSGIDPYGGLLELLAQYGVFTASSKPTVYGEYSDTTSFKWVHPDTGEEHTFGFESNKKGKVKLHNYLNELSEEEREEILEIWNVQLNEIYADATKDLDESVLLESDSVDDGLDENLEEDFSELDE